MAERQLAHFLHYYGFAAGSTTSGHFDWCMDIWTIARQE